MSNDLKLCYIYRHASQFVHYILNDFIVSEVITDKIGKKDFYYQTWLSESDINYIKLCSPNINLFHEGGNYLETTFIIKTTFKLLPKNITSNILDIRSSDIHYVHSSIKYNKLFTSIYQLYHIPKYRYDSLYAIKNYKQEKEKLDRIGEEAYYKEIDEICEKMYEESYKNFLPF